MTILGLIGMVFVIICEIFHGRISLNSVVLLLLVNFVSGFRSQLIYISLIQVLGQTLLIFIVFSCLCSCHSSQKNHFFHLYQQNKYQPVIFAKGFFKLPNFYMLITHIEKLLLKTFLRTLILMTQVSIYQFFLLELT